MVNQLRIFQGVRDEYATNAVAENVRAKATRALPIRLSAAERDIVERPTSHVTYHEKNQGVITRSTPNVASATSTIVRVVGTRHI